jgi:hypothetical protein
MSHIAEVAANMLWTIAYFFLLVGNIIRMNKIQSILHTAVLHGTFQNGGDTECGDTEQAVLAVDTNPQ